MTEQVVGGVVIALVAALLGAALTALRSEGRAQARAAALTGELARITGRLEVVSTEFTNLDKDVAAMLPIAASVTRLEVRLDDIEKDLNRAWDRIHSIGSRAKGNGHG